MADRKRRHQAHNAKPYARRKPRRRASACNQNSVFEGIKNTFVKPFFSFFLGESTQEMKYNSDSDDAEEQQYIDTYETAGSTGQQTASSNEKLDVRNEILSAANAGKSFTLDDYQRNLEVMRTHMNTSSQPSPDRSTPAGHQRARGLFSNNSTPKYTAFPKPRFSSAGRSTKRPSTFDPPVTSTFSRKRGRPTLSFEEQLRTGQLPYVERALKKRNTTFARAAFEEKQPLQILNPLPGSNAQRSRSPFASIDDGTSNAAEVASAQVDLSSSIPTTPQEKTGKAGTSETTREILRTLDRLSTPLSSLPSMMPSLSPIVTGKDTALFDLVEGSDSLPLKKKKLSTSVSASSLDVEADESPDPSPFSNGSGMMSSADKPPLFGGFGGADASVSVPTPGPPDRKSVV